MRLIKFINEQIKSHRINSIAKLLRSGGLNSLDLLKYKLSIKVFEGISANVNNPILQQSTKNKYIVVNSVKLGYSFIVAVIVNSPFGIVPDNNNGARVFPVAGFIVNNITELGETGILIISATNVESGATYIFVRNIYDMSQIWGLTRISSSYLELPSTSSEYRMFFDGDETPTKFAVLTISESDVLTNHSNVQCLYTDGLLIRTICLLCLTTQIPLLSIDLLEKVMDYCDDGGSNQPYLPYALEHICGGLNTKDMYY